MVSVGEERKLQSWCKHPDFTNEMVLYDKGYSSKK